MLENILINGTNLNSTETITNITQPNLTIRLITEIQNTTFSARIESVNLWYDSAFFGVVVGTMLTFLTTITWSWFNKKIELAEYEYKLLSQTNVMVNTPMDGRLRSKIENFKDMISLEPNLFKIQSNELIISILIKLMNDEQTSEEQKKISQRIKLLRQSFWLKFVR